VGAVGTVTAELAARFLLGLGTPPLYVADPRLEYRLKPHQDLHRFGRRIVTNSWGMRSGELSVPKPAWRQRVVVMGDSVVNGGSLIDQHELATSIVQRRRAESAATQVEVANVSAGSWGPGNWRAFAEDSGLFGADVLVLVISSHDASDNPTFAPLDETEQPTRAPISALLEGLSRYAPRVLPTGEGSGPPPLDGSGSAATADAMRDLAVLLRLARATVPRVVVLQHPDRRELPPGLPADGYRHVREVCASTEVECHDLAPYLVESLRLGVNPYRDTIHLNATGQALLASAILDILGMDAESRMTREDP
jgi:lysophospholipase L1-like esterase